MKNNNLSYKSILDIILNKDGLYEGDLIYYFRIVFKFAQNLHNPYHNMRHMLHVMWLCYQACSFYKDEISARDMRNLLIAAIFHDFNHLGLSGDDSSNITRAVQGIKKHVLDADVPYLSGIIKLIEVTEYPHKLSLENLSLSAEIIRDADLAQSLGDVWIQQNIFGFSAEWKQEPFEVLQELLEFNKGLKFHTLWAKQAFPQSFIDDKNRELLGFIDILKD